MAFPTFTGIIIIHVAHLAKELHAHEPGQGQVMQQMNPRNKAPNSQQIPPIIMKNIIRMPVFFISFSTTILPFERKCRKGIGHESIVSLHS